MKYIIFLSLFCSPLYSFFCSPLYSLFSISPPQAQRYQEILSNYNPGAKSAYFFSGSGPSAPLQFSGYIGKEPTLSFRILNPYFSTKNPIVRCEIVFSGKGENRYSFRWTSPNGLMTRFSEDAQGLPAFLLANANQTALSFVFYGESGVQNILSPSPDETRRIFLSLHLYRELIAQSPQ